MNDTDRRVLAFIADPPFDNDVNVTSPSYAYRQEYDHTVLPTVTWDQLEAAEGDLALDFETMGKRRERVNTSG